MKKNKKEQHQCSQLKEETPTLEAEELETSKEEVKGAARDMEVDVKGNAVATIAIADAIAIRRNRTQTHRERERERERERGVCG